MELVRLVITVGWILGIVYIIKFARGIHDQAESIVGRTVAWLIGGAGFFLASAIASKAFDTFH